MQHANSVLSRTRLANTIGDRACIGGGDKCGSNGGAEGEFEIHGGCRGGEQVLDRLGFMLVFMRGQV